MPIIIKAKSGQNSNDIIRQFKKAVAMTDIVQMVKDRRYFVKPSQIKAVKKQELIRQKKRLRSLKRRKNGLTRSN